MTPLPPAERLLIEAAIDLVHKIALGGSQAAPTRDLAELARALHPNGQPVLVLRQRRLRVALPTAGSGPRGRPLLKNAIIGKGDAALPPLEEEFASVSKVVGSDPERRSALARALLLELRRRIRRAEDRELQELLKRRLREAKAVRRVMLT